MYACSFHELYSLNCVVWRIRCTFLHGLGVMQIAIGQGRRNGKENEKEETELGIEI
jgi:hypothetical protein